MSVQNFDLTGQLALVMTQMGFRESTINVIVSSQEFTNARQLPADQGVTQLILLINRILISKTSPDEKLERLVRYTLSTNKYPPDWMSAMHFTVLPYFVKNEDLYFPV